MQADCYEDCVILLMDLYSLLARSQAGYVPVENVFEAVGLRRMDYFRTLCSMALAQGYTRSTLQCLIVFGAEVYAESHRITLEQAEILLTFIRNGDLRLEVMDLCEECIETVQRKENSASSDRILIPNLAVLYVLIDIQEAGEEAAWKDVERILSAPDFRNFKVFWELAHR